MAITIRRKILHYFGLFKHCNVMCIAVVVCISVHLYISDRSASPDATILGLHLAMNAY